MGQESSSEPRRPLWPSAERERRWTLVMDAVIGASLVIWTVVLTFGDPGPTLRWVVPLIIALMVVHRVLVLVEHTHRIQLEEQPVTLGMPVAPVDTTAHAA